MARTKVNDSEKNQKEQIINDRVQKLKDLINEGNFDTELKKYVKTCSAMGIDDDIAFELLLSKFNKKEVTFTKVVKTVWE